AACAKQEAPAPAAADASGDAAEAAGEAVADAATGSDLPHACSDYLARARACFEKAGNNAALAACQEGVDMAEAEWNKAADKSALASACALANVDYAAAGAAPPGESGRDPGPRAAARGTPPPGGCGTQPRFPEHPVFESCE